MPTLLLLSLCFGSALILTGGIRYLALRCNLMDHPNARSSHATPTPRGGGLAFVLVFIAALWIVNLPINQRLVFLLGTSLIALLGLVDDLKGLPPLLRFMVQLGVAVGIVWGLDPVAAIDCGFFKIVWEPLLWGFWVFYLVWLVNLFNFMDGLNGLASLEALFVLTAMAFLYAISGQQPLALLPLCLACSLGGFLYWNFPVARIFMGDVGSGCLGLILGIFSLIGAKTGSLYFFAWLILMAVFMTDATVTLVMRLWQGESIWQAHRSHAYQLMAIRYGSHQRVSLGVLVINLSWLFPLAMLVINGQIGPLTGMLAAYLPLTGAVLAVRLKAAMHP